MLKSSLLWKVFQSHPRRYHTTFFSANHVITKEYDFKNAPSEIISINCALDTHNLERLE